MFQFKFFTIFILCAITPLSLAFERNNAVGVNYYYGVIDANFSEQTEELNDWATAHFQVHAEHYFSQYFSLGVSYADGDSGDVDTLWDNFTDSHITYNFTSINAKIFIPLSQRNAFYIGIKSVQYDYDIVDDSQTVFSDKGNDFGATAGWTYKWSNGLGLDVNFADYTPLGEQITLRTVGAGINYNF